MINRCERSFRAALTRGPGLISFMNPQVNANVMRNSNAGSTCITSSEVKNSNCEPVDRTARARPATPMNRPPIPTQRNPGGAFLARNGPKMMTNPAPPWNKGTATFLSTVICPTLVMAMARKPISANHLYALFQEGKYCSAMPIDIPSGIRLEIVST